MNIPDIVTETSGLKLNNTPNDEVSRQKDDQQYMPIGSDNPGPRTLHQCVTHRHTATALYATRTIAAAMVGAGTASGICGHMMDPEVQNPSQPIFLSLGLLTYFATFAPVLVLPRESVKGFIRQGCQDAIVPALTAFSLYFIQAHGAI